MKKFFAIFLTLIAVFSAVFSLAGCGEYRGPDGGKPNVPGPNGTNPPEESDAPYTVKLTLNGEWYIPETEISAVWNNGLAEYTAPFERGVAQITGLSGEYFVTLSEVPKETGRTFTYDPNAYSATSVSGGSRDVEIELIPITPLRETGLGSDKFNTIKITQTGTYRVTIPRAGKKVYYSFKPKENGEYYIESLVYTAPNEMNPLLDVYGGTFANPFFDHVQDGGGKSSYYTKNFRHLMQIVDDEIGNVFIFSVYVEGENISYPVTVDFTIDRPRDYMRDPTYSYMVVPQEEFKQTPEYDESLYSYVSVANSHRVFLDGGRFKLNPEDGYYHLYDKDTDTYGAILYAKITQPSTIMAAFNGIEYEGNKALTLGEKNYKMFIEGYDHVIAATTAMLGQQGGSEAALAMAKEQYKEYEGRKGYGDYCNSKGVYAVTAELKQFLVEYSAYRSIFYDGLGYAEGQGYTANEGDQWLFACGYYREK